MKVIKRDGRSVDYDRSKIVVAIQKANADLPTRARVTQAQINEIVDYVESQNKKRMLVEDIQDMIEQQLMDMVRRGDTTRLQEWIEHAPAIRPGKIANDMLRQMRNTFPKRDNINTALFMIVNIHHQTICYYQ